MNLYQKIATIMKEVSYLGKDTVVGKGTKSAYKAVSEEKVTMAIREFMIIHGVVIIPIERKFDREDHWYKNSYGGDSATRFTTCETKYKIINIDDPEDFIIASSGGTGVDSQDKGIGKAITYDYKYLLLRVFAIPTGEDPDKIHNAEIDKQIEKDTLKGSKPKEAPKAEKKATKPANDTEEDLTLLQGKASGLDNALKANKILNFGEAARLANKHLGVTKPEKSNDISKLKMYIEDCKELLKAK